MTDPNDTDLRFDISATILVCDDDPTVRLLARECLESAGMSVLEAENGQEALTLFDKQQPDLVFLDVDMPLLNGFEVCRAIRQTERGQSLPVLIATGANDSRSIDQGFEAGATQYKTKPINWALLSRDVKYMLRAAEAFAALKAQQVQLRTLAYYDPLTSLPNRRSFVDQLKKSLDETADHQRSLGLLMVDLDHFKRIHDPLGEALSDSLLKVVAARLEERLSVYAPRGPDPHEAINRSDLDDMTIDLMRPGGDEFNIIVRNIKDSQALTTIASLILETLNAPLIFSDNHLVLSASVGIAMAPEHGLESEAIIRRANIALGAAKLAGRNRYRLYDDSLADDAERKLRLEADLRDALESSDQLFMAYQPQIDTSTGRISGVEALVRWSHPELGAISPALFAPLAEGSGLISQLGDWIFKRVDSDIQTLKEVFPSYLTISINLSPLQFTQANFLETLKLRLSELQSKNAIELELTEGVIMSDADDSLLKLHELRKAGFRLAIDDFGTGYSSLSYLKDFPVNTLKIDQAFVANLGDESGNSIVRAILALATALNLDVVAEGVETHEQADFLTRHHCNILQGFLLAKPIPLQNVIDMLDVDFSHMYRMQNS
ncbi:EAL domain-containing protein [Luminiphilus sp.]|nr:EAL domain-containing protein [Luminiphilus sp.]MDA9580718.1 EAL domain-containing protein [Luminiphilus sp.]MDB2615302.1 EAL domain-containing protein [Luminiphilus sp.]MDB3923115.1 EAL domain-containing protein [Luminiphilus sp.]